MNIALVFDGLQIGGIERVGGDYVRLLNELGHSVTVINLCPQLNQMESEMPEGTRIEHVSFPRIVCPEQYAQLVKRNLLGRFIYPMATIALGTVDEVYKVISRMYPFLKEEYDIAIAFSGHFNDLTFVADGFIRAKAKICWLHGALYGYLITSDGFYNLYKKIRNLVVLVDDAQDEALIYNHQNAFNIHKIYNPTYIANRTVDEDEVKRLKEMYGDFMIMVSRFKYPHKDQFTVCDALEKLVNEYNSNLHLLFIGDGPDEQRVKMHVSKKDERVSSHIHFMGARSDVQNYYAAAKLLVHASVAGEGLPTVMIEALSYNLPMVVTDSKVGPREILGNDEYGLLCKVKDSDDMARKIYRLQTDERLYQKYKTLSGERLEAFKPETIKIQLQAMLNDMMAKSHVGGY
ncbi:glycosyltransferase [Oribacterium sp. FC2011]|uniref:glycosyltransferase n=1 Tax=Oribacterium sp. FC2011 TaxID=1408311 RepID=UPI0004E18D22|nr:glycosyltransferase [Oribacterium sp. FC2011]